VVEVLGFDLLTIHAIPGGLWEVFIGVWLIVKGFNPSAFASDPDTTDIAERDEESELSLSRA
jgi:hypothetical protein